jgi:hypothetical protein
MQSVLNQMFRTVFWMFVRLPLTVAQKVIGGVVAGKVAATQIPRQQEEEDPLVSPTSRQGQKDQRDYEAILDDWADWLRHAETLARNQEDLKAAIALAEGYETSYEEARGVLGEMEASFNQIEAEVKEDIIPALDRLEARNTGMKELKRRRAQLAARQEGVERFFYSQSAK